MRSTTMVCLTAFIIAEAPARASSTRRQATSAPAAQEPPQQTTLGAPSGLDLGASAAARLVLEAGTRVYPRPDSKARPLTRLDALNELEVVESREGWSRVRLGSRLGWVRGDGAPLALPATDPGAFLNSVERRALEALGESLGGQPRWRSEAFELWSDLDRPQLLADLQTVLASLPAVYAERYGLEPRTGVLGSIVLLAAEEDYRRYRRQYVGPDDRRIRGHAGDGLAVLFAGQRSPEEILGLAVHEATHLLNRRHLGFALPPWLEEGLAEDMAYLPRGDDGGLLGQGFGGGRSGALEAVFDEAGRQRVVRRTEYSGPQAALHRLQRLSREGERPELSEILDAPAGLFTEATGRQLRYDLSGMWVRYLVDGGDARHRETLRRALQGLERDTPGAEADLYELLGDQLLGDEPGRLEKAWQEWLRATARRELGRR